MSVRLIIGVILVGVALTGWWYTRQAQAIKGPSITCQVLTIYDGDTLGCDMNGNHHVDGKPEHIRLLGIDTPEMHYSRKNKTGRDAPFAAEAKQWLAHKTLNKSIKLVYDVRQTDKYRRQLAHVYLPGQTPSLNQQLLRMGYARLMFIAPNQGLRAEYTQALNEARQQHLALWQ